MLAVEVKVLIAHLHVYCLFFVSVVKHPLLVWSYEVIVCVSIVINILSRLNRGLEKIQEKKTNRNRNSKRNRKSKLNPERFWGGLQHAFIGWICWNLQTNKICKKVFNHRPDLETGIFMLNQDKINSCTLSMLTFIQIYIKISWPSLLTFSWLIICSLTHLFCHCEPLTILIGQWIVK